MVRWLLLGLLLYGLGTGFNRGWLQLRWGLLIREMGFPFVCEPEDGTRCYPRELPNADKLAR